MSVSGAPFTSLNHNTTNQAGEWQDSPADKKTNQRAVFDLGNIHYAPSHSFHLQYCQSVAGGGHRISENWPKSQIKATYQRQKATTTDLWKTTQDCFTNTNAHHTWTHERQQIVVLTCERNPPKCQFFSFQRAPLLFYSTLSHLLDKKKIPSRLFFRQLLWLNAGERDVHMTSGREKEPAPPVRETGFPQLYSTAISSLHAHTALTQSIWGRSLTHCLTPSLSLYCLSLSLPLTWRLHPVVNPFSAFFTQTHTGQYIQYI